MIETTFDEHASIIRIVGTGSWTITEVEAHYAALSHLLASLRARGLPIRILSDVSRADLQTPRTEAKILELAAEHIAPDDRVALIAASSAVKAHVRQVAGSQTNRALFCSHAAAETWLTAHDHALSA